MTEDRVPTPDACPDCGGMDHHLKGCPNPVPRLNMVRFTPPSVMTEDRVPTHMDHSRVRNVCLDCGVVVAASVQPAPSHDHEKCNGCLYIGHLPHDASTCADFDTDGDHCVIEHAPFDDGPVGYPQPAPPLDVERLRQHEPEPGMGNYATWRWDCSCGWHDSDADAQKWWTHVLGSEAL